MATLRELWAGLADIRVVAPSMRASEEAFLVASEESDASDADLIEDGLFVSHPVSPSAEPGFTHFLDGAQRAVVCGYVGMNPLVLAHTSAAIVERCDRVILPPEEERYLHALELFAPATALVPSLPDLEVRPVRVDENKTGYVALQEVRNAVSSRRDEWESSVAGGFESGRLLVDGGLGHLLGLDRMETVAGIVKSHQRQYFQSRERVEVIANLGAGERSTVFRRDSGKK